MEDVLTKPIPKVSSCDSVPTEWVVFSGAPSSGKTSTLIELERRGHRCVREAARVYIERLKSEGQTLEEICRDLAKLERDLIPIKAEIEKGLPTDERVFMDLAMPDSLTYYRTVGLDPAELIEPSTQFHYRAVFIFDRLPLEDDGVRYLDEEMCQYLDQQLETDYRALGYATERVPVLSIEARADFILARLKEIVARSGPSVG